MEDEKTLKDYEAEIAFDAVPVRVFRGKVGRIIQLTRNEIYLLYAAFGRYI